MNLLVEWRMWRVVDMCAYGFVAFFQCQCTLTLHETSSNSSNIQNRQSLHLFFSFWHIQTWKFAIHHRTRPDRSIGVESCENTRTKNSHWKQPTSRDASRVAAGNRLDNFSIQLLFHSSACTSLIILLSINCASMHSTCNKKQNSFKLASAV